MSETAPPTPAASTQAASSQIAAGLTARTERRMRAALERGGWWRLLAFAGPAVVTSVAYVDPGNFVTNIQAGAQYGYSLLWVVVMSNIIAMLFQGLSARLGIVAGHNLAELSRHAFPRPVSLAMWVVAELAAMATDLAEFVGGAVGLSLLTRLPLLAAMAVVGGASLLLLSLQRRGFRPLELVIGTLVGVIAVSYLVELAIAPPDWGAVLRHSVVPSLPDRGALALAIGMLGATVMPHAIYLHSGLTQARLVPRDQGERRRMLGYSHAEVIVALAGAGLVNMAMVAMAVSFHHGHAGVADLGGAYRTLTPLLGPAAGIAFLAALLASGLSSTVVGTMAGQMVMQGFTGRTIPVWLRRAVTMLPAFVVIGAGFDATSALIDSQIVLSFALPVPMAALLLISRDMRWMGGYALRGAALWLPGAAVVVVTALNALLVLQGVGVDVPGLG